MRFINKIFKMLMLLFMIACLVLVASSSPVPHDHDNSSSPRSERLKGLSALHLAAAENRLDVLTTLLRDGEDINARSADGSTVLHTAAANGNLQLVSMILQSGNALINPQNNYLFTPLVLAERNRHSDVASLLKSTIGNISTALLRDSAINGNLDQVRSLVLKGADVNGLDSYNLTPLHKAARYNFLEVAIFLVEHGADLTIRALGGQIPLFEAAYYGNLDIVIYLVENGSDINTPGYQGLTPMHAATNNNYLDQRFPNFFGGGPPSGGSDDRGPQMYNHT